MYYNFLVLNVCNIESSDTCIIYAGFYLLGGGGGEASTPSTISSPPKHNYELIIIHVFVSF